VVELTTEFTATPSRDHSTITMPFLTTDANLVVIVVVLPMWLIPAIANTNVQHQPSIVVVPHGHHLVAAKPQVLSEPATITTKRRRTGAIARRQLSSRAADASISAAMYSVFVVPIIAKRAGLDIIRTAGTIVRVPPAPNLLSSPST
jgi:hypothetical protein